MASGKIIDAARWYDPLFSGVLGGIREQATRMTPSRDGMKILDVGCGTGKQLAGYQDVGGELFGIDLSPQMLEVARSNLIDSVGLVNGDALKLPYSRGTFDLVVSSLFLHQLNAQDRSMVLNEIMRVLKFEGSLLLVDFHPQSRQTFLGRLTYIAISVLEFFAGREHFQNSRNFLSQGGVPQLAAERNFAKKKMKILGNGNLGIYLFGLT